MKALVLWLAQGLGVGRIPVAPGTLGSLLGLGWFALLLLTGQVWMCLAGLLLGLAASVWLCGLAERILKKTDPASVVLDEIAAVPVCFAGWVAVVVWKTGALPTPAWFCSGRQLWATLAVFAAFRFFDVLKPWPVKQSQRLPGGWGVTVDDLLAAVYVNVGVLLAGVGGLL